MVAHLAKRACQSQADGALIAFTVVVALFLGVFAAIFWRYCWCLKDKKRNPKMNALLPWWLFGFAMLSDVISAALQLGLYISADCGDENVTVLNNLLLAEVWFDCFVSLFTVATFLFPLGNGLNLYQEKLGKIVRYILITLFGILAAFYFIYLVMYSKYIDTDTYDYNLEYLSSVRAIRVLVSFLELFLCTGLLAMFIRLRVRRAFPPGDIAFWVLAAGVVFELQVLWAAINEAIEAYLQKDYTEVQNIVIPAIQYFLLAEACYVTIKVGSHKVWREERMQENGFGFGAPMSSLESGQNARESLPLQGHQDTSYAAVHPGLSEVDGNQPWAKDSMPHFRSGGNKHGSAPGYYGGMEKIHVAPGTICPTCGEQKPAAPV